MTSKADQARADLIAALPELQTYYNEYLHGDGVGSAMRAQTCGLMLMRHAPALLAAVRELEMLEERDAIAQATYNKLPFLCCESALVPVDGVCPVHHGDACIVQMHPAVAEGLRFACDGADKYREALSATITERDALRAETERLAQERDEYREAADSEARRGDDLLAECERLRGELESRRGDLYTLAKDNERLRRVAEAVKRYRDAYLAREQHWGLASYKDLPARAEYDAASAALDAALADAPEEPT